MFFLSQLEHKLRLPPHKLNTPFEQAIIDELQSIFLDKVIPKLGLCVSVYDIKSIDGGFVLPNDGAPIYTVVFRMIMFRPYVGEIITGKLMESHLESDLQGIRLTLGFFDDIYIPSIALPKPSKYVAYTDKLDCRKKQMRWVWDSEDAGDLPIDGDEIRFRVVTVDYPSIPLEQEKDSKPFAPMVVTGQINMEGLGPADWWV